MVIYGLCTTNAARWGVLPLTMATRRHSKVWTLSWLEHSLLYYRKPKGRISLACWKIEAYFAHLSCDFPSSK
jgi:hypothetical protein